MIVSIYLEEHQYLTDKPQTLNFGGNYLYSYKTSGANLIVSRKLNDKHIPGFFDISESTCRLNLLSAIVGQNGVGKSSVLDSIRSIFVPHVYSMPHNSLTTLIEVDGNTKVLVSHYEKVYLKSGDDDNPKYERLEVIGKKNYQTIYYSPHFDLKYNTDFDEVDKYDISLDQFINQDLENTEYKGTNENGWKFGLHEELIFKNSIRQIEFLASPVFNENDIFQKVFDLPQYQTGILHFRDVKFPEFWNTPRQLRPIIELIKQKAEKEHAEWHLVRDSNLDIGEKERQALVNRHLLDRFVIKAFLSVIVQQMEKGNDWLEEGKIEDPYNLDRFENLTAKEVFQYFIEKSFIEFRESRTDIFNKEEIFELLEELGRLFSMEKNPDFIKKQSIRIHLQDLKKILEKHRKIVNHLVHYYPLSEGLVKKGDYTEGFIAFRPTDRNLSSGENALLNFFSKLYAFIEDNLTEERKSLQDKENYILLLDEADLGFHPVWKKKYIDSVLKTLPYFFQSLRIKPNLQIIITTHDPLTLSDLPINNIVLLKKDSGFCDVITQDDKAHLQKTFGANITDLLAHSFFIEDGLIGDFSKSKIQEVVRWINSSKRLSENQRSSSRFKKEVDYYRRVVGLVDETIVKIKLTEMITDIFPDDVYYNKIIDQEIEHLKSKKK